MLCMMRLFGPNPHGFSLFFEHPVKYLRATMLAFLILTSTRAIVVSLDL